MRLSLYFKVPNQRSFQLITQHLFCYAPSLKPQLRSLACESAWVGFTRPGLALVAVGTAASVGCPSRVDLPTNREATKPQEGISFEGVDSGYRGSTPNNATDNPQKGAVP